MQIRKMANQETEDLELECERCLVLLPSGPLSMRSSPPLAIAGFREDTAPEFLAKALSELDGRSL